jgi:hypothetical protein
MPDTTYGWEMRVEIYTPKDMPGSPHVIKVSGISGKVLLTD